MKLLNRLMSSFKVDSALIGDISEGVPSHSAFWLLRQCVAAILSTVATGLWNHKLRTASAVALGWSLWSAYVLVMHRIFNPQIHPFFLSVALTAVWAFLVGWIVAQSHPAQPLGTNLLLMTTSFTLIAPDIARTVQTIYVTYPASRSYFWPVLLKLLASNASFLLATILGGVCARPRIQATE